MKARSASLTMYHFQPGHHREVCSWHDNDHKPEVVGTMPDVFISQRWVAPPDWVALRPPTELPHQGGEYVNLYWSSGTPEEMTSDFQALGERLTAAGRMQPMQYIERTAGYRLRPVSVQTRRGLPLSGEAVTASVTTTGLMVVIGEVAAGPEGERYAYWHEHEHIPMILDTGLFMAAAKLAPSDPAQQRVHIVLYYTDAEDPKATYDEFHRVAATWTAAGSYPDIDRARRPIFSGMFRPSIGHYDYYD